jgi:hypothetical protein
MKKEINKTGNTKLEKLKKYGKNLMFLVGLYLILIAPRQFSTIPVWAYWLGIICIVAFVGWNIVTAYIEYYRKEQIKGWRNERKAKIVGIAIIVISVIIFIGVKFSGLSQIIFKQYYGGF